MGVNSDSQNMIETTFHPEYGYGDFVAKLLPKTKPKGGIEYLTHAGPLIKALARAYADLNQPVLLVIDEINRGNCAQIFGDIFQLLDRKDNGWSEYGVDPSDLIMDALKQEMGDGCLLPELVQVKAKDKDSKKIVSGYKLRLPPNLSLIGTMNTSDESVYYMDTAFKRRWNFDYMPWSGASDMPALHKEAKIGADTWHSFLEKLNDFISHKFKERSVDDKQVGIWFLKSQNLTLLGSETINLSAEQREYKKKLENFRSKLEKLSASSCKDGRNREWESCFPGTKDDTRAKLITTENYKVINEHLTKEYKIKLTDNFFHKLGPSQLAAELIKLIDGIIAYKVIAKGDIKNKLMFFLWDNVFSRSREPLYVLLEKGGAGEKKPCTFGAFSGEVNAFIDGVMRWDHGGHKWQE